MIEISNINFQYSNRDIILNNFSAQFKKGQIVSIVGNSGCGKSTLLNLIAGLLKPNSGIIKHTGELAYLTQIPTLLSYKTAFENALLACELRNILSMAKISEADSLFQQFNLTNSSKNKFPNELSGGMKQRIGLIQTMLIDSDIYLFDEPFNAIDKGTVFKIQNYLWDKIKNTNTIAILVTHDFEQAVLTSDQVICLPQGSFINFDKEFTSQPPQERHTSKGYSDYLLQLFRKKD